MALVDPVRLTPPQRTRPATADAEYTAPPPWRIRRLFLAIGLVLTGLTLIIVPVAFIFWPADLILAGVLALVLGAFFIRIEPQRAPSPPER